MKLKLTGLLLTAFLAVTAGCQKQGDRIETIGSHKITTKEFEDYYSAYVEKASMFTGAEKETFAKYMCNPDLIQNQMAAELTEKLDPQNNYEEYRQMLIIQEVAQKEGFTEKPEIKEILRQVVLETTIRLYLQEKLEERIKISAEEKQTACEELRKQYPDRVGPLPLDDCLYMAEMSIKQNRMRMEEGKLRDEIRESIVIDKNKDFDREKFLTKELKLYQTLRKDGGCADQPAAK